MLQVQPYLRNGNLHNEEACTITALRSNCVKNVKSNFSSMHKDRIHCPLLCNSENPEIDTQEHLLTCKSLNIENPTKLTIDSANSDLPQQVDIGKIICKALKKRKKLLENIENGTTTRGGRPIAVLWGGLLNSSPTPTPPQGLDPETHKVSP